VSGLGPASNWHGVPRIGRALISGANGFLGRNVGEALLADGWEVVGAIRTPIISSVPGLSYIRIPDLSDRSVWRKALEGVDAVVHLAARVHVMRDTVEDPLEEFRRVNVHGTRILVEESIQAGVQRFILEEFRRVNVHGTRILVEESIQAGVQRFIFASSVKAVAEQGPVNDQTVPFPTDAYGISKLEAEFVVAGARELLHASSLRFPLIYGPGMKGNMLGLFRMIDFGFPLPLRSIRNRRSLLFVRNAAEAIRTLLRSFHPSGETFLCSDGHDVSTPELIEEIGRVLGRKPRLFPFPTTVLGLAGKAGDLVARFRPFPLTTAALERLSESLYVDSSRLRAMTGYRPPHELSAGLSETGAWYRGKWH
jgi:nucleoside-diphosphate-sugar epimerase